MKIEVMKNKDGKTLETKDGKIMYENKLESGDSFIPMINSVLETKHDAEVRGEKKIITQYSIPAKVKDANGEKLVNPDSENGAFFIKLTPTQAKKLQALAEEGVELNQTIFHAYEYDHKEHGKCIGVTNKAFKEPIDFE